MNLVIKREVFRMMNISRVYREYNGFIYRVLASLDYEGFLLYITHKDCGDMMFL